MVLIMTSSLKTRQNGEVSPECAHRRVRGRSPTPAHRHCRHAPQAPLQQEPVTSTRNQYQEPVPGTSNQYQEPVPGPSTRTQNPVPGPSTRTQYQDPVPGPRTQYPVSSIQYPVSRCALSTPRISLVDANMAVTALAPVRCMARTA